MSAQVLDIGRLRDGRARAAIWRKRADENSTTLVHEAALDLGEVETLRQLKAASDSVFFKHGKRGYTLSYIERRGMAYARSLHINTNTNININTNTEEI